MQQAPDVLARPERAAACPRSRHCRPAPTLLAELGLPATTPARWLHLGPIGQHKTALVMHSSAGASVQNNGGGGVRECDSLRTRREHRAHLGFHLDLFGTLKRPPVQASYSAADRLWVVAAYAWRRADGPWAEWRSVFDGLCETSTVSTDYHFAADPPCDASIAELGRCLDLICGRTARRGHPSRGADRTVPEIVARAVALKRAHPRMPQWQIAIRCHVGERTLARYLADYRRATAASLVTQPLALLGG